MTSTRTPSVPARLLQWLDRWTLNAFNPPVSARSIDYRRAV